MLLLIKQGTTKELSCTEYSYPRGINASMKGIQRISTLFKRYSDSLRPFFCVELGERLGKIGPSAYRFFLSFVALGYHAIWSVNAGEVEDYRIESVLDGIPAQFNAINIAYACYCSPGNSW